MTNFINGLEPKKEVNKTVFTNYVQYVGSIKKAVLQTKDFANVKLISSSDAYGDMFEAWNDTDIQIYIGKAGDEFK